MGEKRAGRKFQSFINANYYFVTFTIPKKLEEILKVNKRAGYSLLFKSSSYAILSFYKEKRVKGGIISILQTFGRTLNFHPHIHLLCTVGGLLFNRTAWKEVFLPALVLQKRFKHHFLDGLRELYRQGELQLPEDISFANYAEFDFFLRELGKRHWQIDRSEPLDAVRFYGLFSTRSKKKLIKKAAEFIPPLATTGVDISKCPKCGEKMELAKVYYFPVIFLFPTI